MFSIPKLKALKDARRITILAPLAVEGVSGRAPCGNVRDDGARSIRREAKDNKVSTSL